MSIELISATEADREIVRNLSAYYIYDFTEYTGWSCPKNGLFAGCDELFDDWSVGKNHPFVIKVNGELAGFAGVAYDDDSGEHFIQEFFIMRKFRRKGVGKSIALMLFDRFPGKWKVQQLTANTPAVGFWRAIIDEYTNSVFTHEVVDSPWGTMDTLRFSNQE